ncbi:sensor histidine kinase [Ktedonosporobacter rubrisoli]|uniref:histidine kinase n=1 Tax=Ktedonosporobacter rubrisoli TaxID=2509675 RepID=A0A4P6JXK5_KTERU|nr:ATP-binding protein [Ktedonosporobacter rubrisoli]QBD80489.1 sensor histidine kinase [Ktedonosporobacter rubrisoli]
MSTSTWGSLEQHNDEGYPSSLLKILLKQMMARFAAQGACLALPDESIGQMRIRLHLRMRNAQSSIANLEPGHMRPSRRRMAVQLMNNALSSASPERLRHAASAGQDEEVEELTAQQCPFLAVGSVYTRGVDLIGHAWLRNDAFVMSHDEYVASDRAGNPLPFNMDVVPSSYLVVPVQEATLVESPRGQKQKPPVIAVIVLYRVAGGLGSSFHPRQRAEAMTYVERVALYLQNDSLQRSQHRAREYLQRLQAISTAFPTSVKLSDLIENMYQFTSQVVDVSSMLLTLYDRDTERIYDVFAICNGVRIDSLAEQAAILQKEERPVWWQVTQEEKCMLHFSPAQDVQKANAFRELLSGMWGDQRKAESFLFLPMKMFNRVIGSLSITSKHSHAYHDEEILVLETMVQIVTVSIENAKLYERDRQLLQKGKQREGQLAAINSALLSISSVLNLSELLNSFVHSVAELVNVEICVFLRVSPSSDTLVAQAIYGFSSVSQVDDGSGLPPVTPPRNQAEHDTLINRITIPFKGTFLEEMVNEVFFYLEESEMEELAQKCDEGGIIFLREMQIRQILMIPMSYQSELVGMLAVPIMEEGRFFKPNEVGILQAICAQATSAVRNAQLFEQKEEAYAELQHMDKLKDEFLVTASHELRTPLSAISGYASLLQRQSSRISAQQVLRFASKISSAAQQLTDLVANMTEAAKMGAVDKKLALQMGPVQVRAAAEIAANMLTLSKEQVLDIDADPYLWVNGDALHFRQVMTNLLENAAKYSPPASRIRLSASVMTLAEISEQLSADQVDHTLLLEQPEQSVVVIRVQDQGEGILPDDQQRIFDKFVRAPRSLTTPVRGAGLGLFICRRYIEAMSGRLWLEQSIPNEGSTFSFYLPRIDPPVELGEQDTGEYRITRNLGG